MKMSLDGERLLNFGRLMDKIGYQKGEKTTIKGQRDKDN
jgi:hypothetical protein